MPDSSPQQTLELLILTIQKRLQMKLLWETMQLESFLHSPPRYLNWKVGLLLNILSILINHTIIFKGTRSWSNCTIYKFNWENSRTPLWRKVWSPCIFPLFWRFKSKSCHLKNKTKWFWIYDREKIRYSAIKDHIRP